MRVKYARRHQLFLTNFSYRRDLLQKGGLQLYIMNFDELEFLAYGFGRCVHGPFELGEGFLGRTGPLDYRSWLRKFSSLD